MLVAPPQIQDVGVLQPTWWLLEVRAKVGVEAILRQFALFSVSSKVKEHVQHLRRSSRVTTVPGFPWRRHAKLTL